MIDQSDLSEQKGCNYSQDSTKSFEYTEDDKKGDDKEGSKAGSEVFPEEEIIQTNDNDQKKDKSNEDEEEDKQVVEAEIAKDLDQELISLDGLRQAIVNREKQILDSDLAKFGFDGIRVDKLNNKTDPMTGTIGINTELDGDLEKANKIYEAKVKDFSRSRRLIREEIKISDGGAKMVSSIFYDESRVQLRTFGKSGHPKVEITDNVKNTYEKITFK